MHVNDERLLSAHARTHAKKRKVWDVFLWLILLIICRFDLRLLERKTYCQWCLSDLDRIFGTVPFLSLSIFNESKWMTNIYHFYKFFFSSFIFDCYLLFLSSFIDTDSVLLFKVVGSKISTESSVFWTIFNNLVNYEIWY